MIVIGEAVSNLSSEIKTRFQEIEWILIKDLRNFLIHEYFGIDSEIIWDVVKKELNPLYEKIILIHKELVSD